MQVHTPAQPVLAHPVKEREFEGEALKRFPPSPKGEGGWGDEGLPIFPNLSDEPVWAAHIVRTKDDGG
jgi:hypothetical protein